MGFLRQTRPLERHRSMPNTHARQNNCSAAYPNVRPDIYRFTELFSTALLSVEWMHRSVDLHRRAKEGEAADLHWTDVEHDAVEVEENPLSELDVRAIVAEEGRLHPNGVATGAKQLVQDLPPFLVFHFLRCVQRLT